MDAKPYSSALDNAFEKATPIVIERLEEKATVGKEVIETGKVQVRTRVVEEVQTLNIPLVHEGYDVQRIPVNKTVAAMPSVRQQGDTTIVPVVREVLVVQKQYEIVEEVHIIKQKTVIPHMQEITLLKEKVTVERTSGTT